MACECVFDGVALLVLWGFWWCVVVSLGVRLMLELRWWCCGSYVGVMVDISVLVRSLSGR